MRKIFFAGGDLACLFDPVFAERSLQAIDDRSGHAKARVAPMVVILRVSFPFLRESETADVSDAAVDDGQLPMIAIVHASEIAEPQRMKCPELNARFAHRLREPAIHLAPAGCIDQQTHFHSLASLRRERVGDLVADRTLPPHERLDVNALASGSDVGEKRWKELIPVFEQLRLVAGIETPLRQAHERWEQPGEIAGLFHLQARIASAIR